MRWRQGLEEAVRKARALTDGAQAAGPASTCCQASPRDVGDDGGFRYVVLGAGAAAESGKPSAAAKRILDETTGPDRPRVHRNAVVLVAPSRDGLEAARAAVRAQLGWEDVQRQLGAHSVDPIQGERLRRRLQEARGRVPDVIRQAYAVVVTVNERNEVHAFKLGASGGPLFPEIKNDERARIKETAVDAETLLPGGPYDLWREDEDARRVTGPRRRLRPFSTPSKAAEPEDSARNGSARGGTRSLRGETVPSRRKLAHLVARTGGRGDAPGSAARGRAARQGRTEPSTRTPARPGVLPELWTGAQVTLPDLVAYFAGGHAVRIPKEGYDETRVIPRCSASAVQDAVRRAVEVGIVWLTNGPTSVWKEQIPYGVLDDNAVLHPKPDPIAVQELVDDALPEAWRDGATNGIALTQALSRARGKTLPWGLVRESIKAGVDSRWLTLADSSVAVKCAYDEAGQLRLERPAGDTKPDPPHPKSVAGTLLEGSQIQDLAELIPKLLETSAGNELRFLVSVVLNRDGDDNVSNDARATLDKLLATVSEDLKIDEDGL